MDLKCYSAAASEAERLECLRTAARAPPSQRGNTAHEGCGEAALLQVNAGAGYALSSYLPPGGPDKVRSSFHIRGCGERGPAMDTDDWPELPAWTEKRSSKAYWAAMPRPRGRAAAED